jgi:hypothetical protein
MSFCFRKSLSREVMFARVATACPLTDVRAALILTFLVGPAGLPLYLVIRRFVPASGAAVIQERRCPRCR